MHYIQKQILDTLRTVPTMHYAQLNKERVESGHFRYHLRELIKDGYVAPVEWGVYSLTLAGQTFVDTLSAGRIHPSAMPKVITYTLLRDGDTLLLYKKPKQPYMGLLNLVGGKMHEGELAVDAAVREVYEKTGVSIEPPQLAGAFAIRTFQSSDLLTHVVAYVFVAEVDPKQFAQTTLVTMPVSALATATNLAPDCAAILGHVRKSHSPQIVSLDVSV